MGRRAMIQWEYAELLADQHGRATTWYKSNGEFEFIRGDMNAVAYLSQVASPKGWNSSQSAAPWRGSTPCAGRSRSASAALIPWHISPDRRCSEGFQRTTCSTAARHWPGCGPRPAGHCGDDRGREDGAGPHPPAELLRARTRPADAARPQPRR